MAAATRFACLKGKEASELIDLSLTNTTVDPPNAQHICTDIEGPTSCNVEYDPKLYYPPDVYRKPSPTWPDGFRIDVMRLLRDKIVSRINAVFGADS